MVIGGWLARIMLCKSFEGLRKVVQSFVQVRGTKRQSSVRKLQASLSKRMTIPQSDTTSEGAQMCLESQIVVASSRKASTPVSNTSSNRQLNQSSLPSPPVSLYP